MNGLEQKLIAEFRKFNCSQRNAAATYQVYIELCEVRRMFEVNYYYDAVLNRMYLTAKDSKSAPVSVFYPICTSENVSFESLQQVLKLSQSKSVYLAIISPDSTCVYYEISKGLADINKPCSSNLENRLKHDSELNNKRTDIEESLNMNLSVISEEKYVQK